MRKIQLGTEFFVASIVSMICAILLLFIITQEETIDMACVAIESGNNQVAYECMEDIVNIDGVGTRKETMLMVACKSGNTEMIKYLLEAGADPNKSVPGKLTPLELFCNDGYEAGVDTLLLLLRAGAKQSNYTLQPAIIYLAENTYWMTDKQKEIAAEEMILLLKSGAPMGYGDTTLLHLAAKSNMSEFFNTIVHTMQGLSLLVVEDQDGRTPWEVALKYGAIDVQRVIRGLEDEYKEDQKDDATNPTNPVVPTNPTGSVDDIQ